MKSIGLKFKEQWPILKITFADFYVPKSKLAIYADGDYWHSRPGAQIKDIKQTKALKNAGYNVLRFKEKDINDGLDMCIRKIKNRIKSIAKRKGGAQ